MKNSKAILQVPGTMKIISAEIPVPKEDEVLIKVEYVGICGSDVHGFESGPFIPPKDPNQEIGLGHECAGTVVAVGSRVRKFKPGDRVNIEPGVPCGHCRYCLEGKYNICPDVDFMATQPNYRGALTHYLCHPESFTYKLPEWCAAAVRWSGGTLWWQSGCGTKPARENSPGNCYRTAGQRSQTDAGRTFSRSHLCRCERFSGPGGFPWTTGYGSRANHWCG